MKVEGFPEISCYGRYRCNNYGNHCLRVDIGPVSLWFSYKTLVAFSVGNSVVVHDNDWGRTTGKHLTWIDGGGDAARQRLRDAEFQDRFEREVMSLFRPRPDKLPRRH